MQIVQPQAESLKYHRFYALASRVPFISINMQAWRPLLNAPFVKVNSRSCVQQRRSQLKEKKEEEEERKIRTDQRLTYLDDKIDQLQWDDYNIQLISENFDL